MYFKLDSVPEGLVLACDRWLRVEDNIAAVAAHIGALRGIDRWGVGSVRQAFAGYKRLGDDTRARRPCLAPGHLGTALQSTRSRRLSRRTTTG